jgi:hypothetical protein
MFFGGVTHPSGTVSPITLEPEVIDAPDLEELNTLRSKLVGDAVSMHHLTITF